MKEKPFEAPSWFYDDEEYYERLKPRQKHQRYDPDDPEPVDDYPNDFVW